MSKADLACGFFNEPKTPIEMLPSRKLDSLLLINADNDCQMMVEEVDYHQLMPMRKHSRLLMARN